MAKKDEGKGRKKYDRQIISTAPSTWDTNSQFVVLLHSIYIHLLQKNIFLQVEKKSKHHSSWLFQKKEIVYYNKFITNDSWAAQNFSKSIWNRNKNEKKKIKLRGTLRGRTTLLDFFLPRQKYIPCTGKTIYLFHSCFDRKLWQPNSNTHFSFSVARLVQCSAYAPH